jgi:hypothetical protein
LVLQKIQITFTISFGIILTAWGFAPWLRIVQSELSTSSISKTPRQRNWYTVGLLHLELIFISTIVNTLSENPFLELGYKYKYEPMK